MVGSLPAYTTNGHAAAAHEEQRDEDAALGVRHRCGPVFRTFSLPSSAGKSLRQT